MRVSSSNRGGRMDVIKTAPLGQASGAVFTLRWRRIRSYRLLTEVREAVEIFTKINLVIRPLFMD